VHGTINPFQPFSRPTQEKGRGVLGCRLAADKKRQMRDAGYAGIHANCAGGTEALTRLPLEWLKLPLDNTGSSSYQVLVQVPGSGLVAGGSLSACLQRQRLKTQARRTELARESRVYSSF
jgi:hypothetical protein